VGDHVARVSEALALANVGVSVITSVQSEDRARLDGVTVKAIIDRWDWSGWKRVFREVVTGAFSAVHFEYPTRYPVPRSQILRCLPLTLPFVIFSWMHPRRIPRVLTVHEYYKSNLFVRIKVQIDALLSDKVIVVTPVEEEKLKRNPLLKGKIHFMPVGPNTPIRDRNPARIAQLRHSQGVAPDEKLICFFGFLAPSRGFEDLISAVEILIRGGLRTRVFVIGSVSDERYLAALKNLVHSRGIRDAFIWIGFIENDRIADYIQACDVTVQPYLHGATTNRSSLISTIALGVPAVTTYVEDATPEYFRHEQNMLLVRPNSPEDMAREVLRLLNDSGLRARILDGMRILATRFSWTGAASVSAEIYRSLH
jgi:glycosyltransferase involved in cell wall biosynthesis